MNKMKILEWSYSFLRRKIRKENNSDDESIAVLKQQLSTLSSKINTVESNLSDRVDGIENSLSGRMDTVENGFSTLGNSVGTLSDKVDDLDENVDSYYAQVGAVSSALDDVDDVLERLASAYTTTETKTPYLWVNQKPIYQKTYTGTWGSTGANKTATVEIGFLSNNNVDDFIKAEGTARTSSLFAIDILSSTFSDDWNAIGYGFYLNSDGSLYIASRQVDGASYVWRITVFYTKTTD
jgi:archaellum component FlaC